MTVVVSVFDNDKEQITQAHPYLFSDLDIIKEEQRIKLIVILTLVSLTTPYIVPLQLFSKVKNKSYKWKVQEYSIELMNQHKW